MSAGPELRVCVWRGTTPPQKSRKRGFNLPRGAPEMLELRNVLNIKEFSEKVEKGLKLVIGKVLRRFVFGKTVDLPPPQNF